MVGLVMLVILSVATALVMRHAYEASMDRIVEETKVIERVERPKSTVHIFTPYEIDRISGRKRVARTKDVLEQPEAIIVQKTKPIDRTTYLEWVENCRKLDELRSRITLSTAS